MNKTTIVTIAAARKQLARAYDKSEESVDFYGSGQTAWASKLERGVQTLRRRAVRHARMLVEAMVAKELTRVEKLVIKGDRRMDPGSSTIYLHGTEVLLITHSSQDRVHLGALRQRDLDRFLASRLETRNEDSN